MHSTSRLELCSHIRSCYAFANKPTDWSTFLFSSLLVACGDRLTIANPARIETAMTSKEVQLN